MLLSEGDCWPSWEEITRMTRLEELELVRLGFDDPRTHGALTSDFLAQKLKTLILPQILPPRFSLDARWTNLAALSIVFPNSAVEAERLSASLLDLRLRSLTFLESRSNVLRDCAARSWALAVACDPDAAVIVDLLRANPQVRHVRFRLARWIPSVSPALASALTTASAESIKLRFECDYVELATLAGCPKVVGLTTGPSSHVLDVVASWPNLRELDISIRVLSARSLHRLAKLPSLEDLTLEMNFCGPESSGSVEASCVFQWILTSPLQRLRLTLSSTRCRKTRLDLKGKGQMANFLSQTWFLMT
jgi:hypothetical protein